MSVQPNLKPKLGTWDGWTAHPQAHRLRSHAQAVRMRCLRLQSM